MEDNKTEVQSDKIPSLSLSDIKTLLPKVTDAHGIMCVRFSEDKKGDLDRSSYFTEAR